MQADITTLGHPSVAGTVTALIRDLFAICRSITGDDGAVDAALRPR
jgi:aminopeptidase-like protein